MRKFVIAAGVIFSALIFMTDNASAQENEKSKILTIKRGDTLEKIAEKNNTTYPRLFDANKKIKHPDLIYAGEKIRIPHPSEKLARRTVAVQAQSPSVNHTSNASATSNTSVNNTPITSNTSANNTSANTSSNSAPRTSASSNYNGGVWDRLADCESGGNWSINTGNGYYGGLQFTQATWNSVGGSGSPHNASKAEQIKRGKILQQRSGWGQWPACSSKLGLR